MDSRFLLIPIRNLLNRYRSCIAAIAVLDCGRPESMEPWRGPIALYEKDKLPDDADIKDGGVMITYGFVLRGPEGVFDTLSWEAYREGYDDARYLATLQDAMAKAAGKHRRLVARTERWLGDLTVNADLDAWRLEMARRTEALLKP